MESEILNQKLKTFEKTNSNLRDELEETKKLVSLLERKIKVISEKNIKLQDEKKKLQKKIKDIQRNYGIERELIDIGKFVVKDIGNFDIKDNDKVKEILFDNSINLGADEVNKFILKNKGNIHSNFQNIDCNLLDQRSRDNLINLIDRNSNSENDSKITLDKQNLINLIGLDNYNKIIKIFDDKCNKFIIRKVISSNKYIDFHKDNSKKTMKISLNSHTDFIGGDVIYLSNGKAIKCKQDLNTITIHHNDIIHGVTPIKNGIRYSLFII